MSGLGLVVAFFGYVIVYWAVEGIQGNNQPRFLSYIWPFGLSQTTPNQPAQKPTLPTSKNLPGTSAHQ